MFNADFSIGSWLNPPMQNPQRQQADHILKWINTLKVPLLYKKEDQTRVMPVQRKWWLTYTKWSGTALWINHTLPKGCGSSRQLGTKEHRIPFNLQWNCLKKGKKVWLLLSVWESPFSCWLEIFLIAPTSTPFMGNNTKYIHQRLNSTSWISQKLIKTSLGERWCPPPQPGVGVYKC